MKFFCVACELLEFGVVDSVHVDIVRVEFCGQSVVYRPVQTAFDESEMRVFKGVATNSIQYI